MMQGDIMGSAGESPDCVSLATLAAEQGVWLGAGVDADALRNDAVYRDTLAREFRMITPGWVMKFRALCSRPHTYDFAEADRVVAFAEAHGLEIRGHTLVLNYDIPAWLAKGQNTQAHLEQILRRHIETVVSRYRGRIYAWDVVNEPFEYGAPVESVWAQAFGDDYVAKVLRWTHDIDPEARLFINENWAEAVDEQSNALYALVSDLIHRGVPLHGVGFQMHVGLGEHETMQTALPPREFSRNLRRFSELGLEIHVTEMDVRINFGRGTEQQRLAAQADVYRDVLSVGLQTPGFKALVQWGVCDNDPWIAAMYGVPDKPLLFDGQYSPKPAYHALKMLLIDRRQT